MEITRTSPQIVETKSKKRNNSVKESVNGSVQKEATIQLNKNSEKHKMNFAEENKATQSTNQTQLQNANLQKLEANKAALIAKRDLARAPMLENKAKDPFYQLVELNSSVDEDSEHYFVTVEVPEHEQNNLSAQIIQNKLVLSGRRRSEDSETSKDGIHHETHAYQSYTETIPFSQSINPVGIKQEKDSDTITFIVPKKASYS